MYRRPELEDKNLKKMETVNFFMSQLKLLHDDEEIAAKMFAVTFLIQERYAMMCNNRYKERTDNDVDSIVERFMQNHLLRLDKVEIEAFISLTKEISMD
jgi:hypothetical protein